MIYTSGPSHLGDCLWALHVIRKIPGLHQFYCPVEYHWQLQECADNIVLADIKSAPVDAVNTWIAANSFPPVVYENNIDVVEYLLRWDNALLKEGLKEALRLGGWDPTMSFERRQDVLFDFPVIRRNVVAPEFDILVVNCPPGSNQCPEWNQVHMDELIFQLGKNHRVLATNLTTSGAATVSASVCNIGNLSLRAKCVLAVASGAHWCIHNLWNAHVPKYLFLEPQRLDYGRGDITHAKNVAQMRDELKKGGWL